MDDINIDSLINDFIKDLIRLKYNYKKDINNEKLKKKINNLSKIIKLWKLMNKNTNNTNEESNNTNEESNNTNEDINSDSSDDDTNDIENSISDIDLNSENSNKITNLLDISNILLDNAKMSKGFKIILKYPYEIS